MDLGAFIIPTGIGAAIGGYAGDASFWAREFSKSHRLIVNPNVVNAACFSGITENMLYVEGYSIDEFFKGKLSLSPSQNNKIGIVFDKSIPKQVLNVHINSVNAVKTVYGCNIIGWEITDDEVGTEFFISKTKTASLGKINNADTILKATEKLINQGAEAIAIVCRFNEDDDNLYSKGIGIDPIGGLEAIISHIVSKEFKIPTAHAPAFDDLTVSTEIVDPKCSAEYITPVFLPCVLLGLHNAPKLTEKQGFSIDDLKFLIMPYNSLGSVPVFEADKRKIPVFAVKENNTCMNVPPNALNLKCVKIIETYKELSRVLK